MPTPSSYATSNGAVTTANGAIATAAVDRLPTTIADFETGSTEQWAGRDGRFVAVSQYTHGGSKYAGYVKGDQDESLAFFGRRYLNPPQRPSKLQFHIRESGFSNGEGVRIGNSDGYYEFGVGLDNPQWVVDDAGGPRQVADPQNRYDHWVRIDVQLHWAAETFDVTFTAESDGITYTAVDLPLKHGTDIAWLDLSGYSSGKWGRGTVEAWFDDFGSDVLASGGWTVTQPPIILEDFESPTALDKYGGSTSSATLNTASDIGSQFAQSNGYVEMATGAIPTPRGYEYRAIVSLPPGGWGGIMLCVQDPANPLDNAYLIRVDEDYDRLVIREYAGTTDDRLVRDTETTVAPSRFYIVRTILAQRSIRAALHTLDGVRIADTDTVSTGTFEGGFLGFLGRDPGVRWDSAGRYPLIGAGAGGAGERPAGH